MALSSYIRAPRTKPKIPVQISSNLSRSIERHDQVWVQQLVSKTKHEANGSNHDHTRQIHAAIFEYLEDPPDMTALALICKAHANMYNDLGSAGIIKTKPILWSKYKEEDRLEFFRRLVRWKPMRAFRLCTTCQHFLPVSNPGWGGASHWARLSEKP
jgi:hypothetical protein